MTDDDIRRPFPLPPRRRPDPLAVAIRWRIELLVLLAVAGAWYTLGSTAVTAAVLVLGCLVAAVRPVRSLARGHLQSVIVMHRVRSGLVQGMVVARCGRLPWVVGAHPLGDDAVRVTLWLRSGTTARDVKRALPVITVACGAAHVELVHHAVRQDRVTLLVRRPRWGWWTG
jgi:hypothetical protein